MASNACREEREFLGHIRVGRVARVRRNLLGPLLVKPGERFAAQSIAVTSGDSWCWNEPRWIGHAPDLLEPRKAPTLVKLSAVLHHGLLRAHCGHFIQQRRILGRLTQPQ